MPVISDSQIASAAKSAGWTGKDATIAVAVALAESSGNTNAYNGAFGTYGLWQIYKKVHPDIWQSNWTDPNVNARMGYQVWRQQGWKAWSTYTSGAYLRYYSRAQKAVGSSGDTPPTEKTGIIPDIPNPFQPLTDAAKFITDPHNWIRLGWFVAGGILILIGLFKITGNNQLSPATKAAAGAAVKAVVKV